MITRKLTDITIIVLHCSDSDYCYHDNIETIREWHMKEQGFEDVGYHFVILKSGRIELGRAINVVGAHVKGQNWGSIGICLTGAQEFSEAQFKSAALLIETLALILPNLKKQYGVLPHRFFNKNKTCPNYQLKEVFKYITEKIGGLDIDKNGKLVTP